jgi:SAM-dependent methyltransferase
VRSTSRQILRLIRTSRNGGRIGCGPQREPSYAVDTNGHFVGIDPVRGERERTFDFVQGIGEYLPFADGSFDRVLFATSLDHVLSPVRALAESRRVLTTNGTVNIWFGLIDQPEPPMPLWRRAANVASHPIAAGRNARAALRPAPTPEVPAYERELAVPEGATDLFHVVHLSRPLVSQWLTAAGLEVTDIGRHGSSVFIRSRRR